MNFITFKRKLLLFTILSMTVHSLYAARLYIDSPKTVSSNREPLTVMVLLESEGDIVSGVSGDFSFSSELFDVQTISTQNGIVSLWAEQPHVSLNNFFDQKTHITFEGAIIGGFNGLINPYTSQIFPGIIFTVTLIPKQKGVDVLTLDSVELHAYDNEGTLISSKQDSRRVLIPQLTGKEKKMSTDLTKIDSSTVSAKIYSDESINHGAPYLFVHDSDSSRLISTLLVAESNRDRPEQLSLSEWKKVTNPYVFSFPLTKKYLHIKIIYSDAKYTFVTLLPVENSQSLSFKSRILISIAILIFLMYFYGKKILFKNSKLT